MLASASRKRQKATPHGRLRVRFNDAKRRLHKMAKKDTGKAVRDGLAILWEGDACGLCGKPLGDDKTFDHIVPLSRGGDNTLANLQLAHLMCNQRKNARMVLS